MLVTALLSLVTLIYIIKSVKTISKVVSIKTFNELYLFGLECKI